MTLLPFLYRQLRHRWHTTVLTAAAAGLFACCSAPKNIAYFQNADRLNNMMIPAEQPLRLRPEDKINIVVSSSNPMLTQQFTLTTSNSNNILGATVAPQLSAGKSMGGNQALAYTLDSQGTIDFPVLGRIALGGMTRKEAAEYIQDRLTARKLVSDPIVTVEYVNLGINVLGEVNKPGHIDITKDRLTLIDALAYAGDLTINGCRENVMVNRQTDGVNQVYFVDLTDMQATLQSPVYHLQQNDLVYVSPNKKKKRESRASGNTFNNPSIWISIASLLTTIVALLTR